MSKTTVLWILRLITAGILLQTLYFKFTAQPESIYIFTQLGAEPWGRIGSGVAELVAGILLLLPTTVGLGAALSLGIITGAVFAHLFVLGIEVQGDGGKLFGLAVAVFVGSAILTWVYRREVPVLKTFFN